ncbi:hypothetical protein MKX03_026978 [Papaver bracteatum]|nr:hypothetical protein MKX03_026978 [Papaver bracteatum]
MDGIQLREFDNVDLDDEDVHPTQPILLSSDRSDGNILGFWRRRRRCYFTLPRCTTPASLGYVGIGMTLFLLIVLVLPATYWPHKGPPDMVPDRFAVALNKALLFFDAQMSGRLPKNKRVAWRGDSGLDDGMFVKKGGLVGGFYDGGDNAKSTSKIAYSMTILSWSVLDYSHKYKVVGEYQHVKEIIKWGIDYLLLTSAHSNSSSFIKTSFSIYNQVGETADMANTWDEEYCWQRPEDMNYMRRPTLCNDDCTNVAEELVAAFASASIVFKDDKAFHKKLVAKAEQLFAFVIDRRNSQIVQETTESRSGILWAAGWVFHASGNYRYLSVATTMPSLPSRTPSLRVQSMENKLTGSLLLLTRLRMYLSPGYPFEDNLRLYHHFTDDTMCSFLDTYGVFNYSRGGLIILSSGAQMPLQHAVTAAAIATMFADYKESLGAPAWYCGEKAVMLQTLRDFATSQMEYIIGNNPERISYIVGYGDRFPLHVHHRGASIPSDGIFYGCTEGWEWRDSHLPNPHNITGGMVGGPDVSDGFRDVRAYKNYTEPTLVANAGLVSALVALTNTGEKDHVDMKTMYSFIRPLSPPPPPPPAPWKPGM